MKISDLFKLAFKNFRSRWVVLPLVGIAISAFCLCFAGAVLTTVQGEQALPYELFISAEESKESLSQKALSKISELPDVTAASPVVRVPVTIKTGRYAADLLLTGVNASYISAEFSEGTAFQDSSVMPYLILNEAACKQFSEVKENDSGDQINVDSDEDDDEIPPIDWLNASFSLQAGEDGHWTVSKVCGILNGDKDEDEEAEEPVAYISLAAAKELLQKSGQSAENAGLYVRLRNIGSAQSVSKAIMKLGFKVDNAEPTLQKKWDMVLKEMVYLLVIGIFCLLCSAVLMEVWRKIYLREKKDTWVMLRWIGMKENDIGKIFILQALMISLSGILIGIIAGASLPSFLSAESAETSIYTIQIPFAIAAASAVVCIIFSMFPFIKINNRIASDLR
ncbi:MAG: FtsX-like permease family protein [Christensenellales bacterium]